MRSVGRSVLALVGGIVVAMILMIAIEMGSSYAFPLPEGVSLHDHEAIRAHIDSLPIAAFLMVLAAWIVGTFAGAWVAARLAGRAKLAHGLVIGAFFLAATLMNLAMIPHPIWMATSGLVGLVVSSYLGARLAADSAPRPPAPVTT